MTQCVPFAETIDSRTGTKSLHRDEKGTSHADAKAFLFRLEPGDPVKLNQINHFQSAVRQPIPLQL